MKLISVLAGLYQVAVSFSQHSSTTEKKEIDLHFYVDGAYVSRQKTDLLPARVENLIS